MNLEKNFLNPSRQETPSKSKMESTQVFDIEDEEVFSKKKNQIEQEDSLEIENLKNEIEVIKNENETKKFLTPEKKEEITEIFKKLKEVLSRKEVGDHVRDMLLDANVSAVLAGVKPASEAYVYKKEKFLFYTIIKGVDEKDFKKFQNIIKEFGCNSVIWRDERPGKHNDYHVDVYNNKNVVRAIENSNAFDEEEINLAKKDWHLLYKQLINSAKDGDFGKAFRGGYVYGYPKEDVDVFIKQYEIKKKYEQKGLSRKDLEDTSSDVYKKNSIIEPNELEILTKEGVPVHVPGIKNVVPWASFNLDKPSVQNKIKELEEIFEIEKEIIGDKD